MRRDVRSAAVRHGWQVWGAVVVFLSVAPATWVLGAAPEARWSILSGLGHVLEFGVFALLLGWSGAAWSTGRAGLLRVALAAFTFGLIVELLQWPIPYRSADVRDLAADLAGIAVAVLIVAGMRRDSALGRLQ